MVDIAGTGLGRMLVIANPAARSGAGEEGARIVADTLASLGLAGTFKLRMTSAPGDATRIARSSTGFDTVVALGGDGVIHEVVNGLMRIGSVRRPRLGVIPLGSGNDYARTLGMSPNDPGKSLSQLLQGTTRRLDVGTVNGTYFDQTLSFGCDAAIALDTMERRRDRGLHGTPLFAASGVEVVRHQMRPRAFHATLDGRELAGESLVFAVQVGPTYGGGFRICPGADPTDGLLDVCLSQGSPSRPAALALLARARLGLHTGSRYLRFERARSLVVEFEEEPPCQADGERFGGTRFEVGCERRALEVVVPRRRM